MDRQPKSPNKASGGATGFLRQLRDALSNSAIGRYWRAAKQLLSLPPERNAKRPTTARYAPIVPTSVLVIGPSSVGKSTLIASPKLAELGLNRPRVVFGNQLSHSKVPANALIHYNMLFSAPKVTGDWNATNAHWDFIAEPIFKKIVTSGLIQHCVVLISPVAEMVERMKQRVAVEETRTGVYDQKFWIEAIQSFDLYRLYGQLFDVLDHAHIPYLVLFSSSQEEHGFRQTDRASTYANLNGTSTGRTKPPGS
jgi:hypothetical protein